MLKGRVWSHRAGMETSRPLAPTLIVMVLILHLQVHHQTCYSNCLQNARIFSLGLKNVKSFIWGVKRYCTIMPFGPLQLWFLTNSAHTYLCTYLKFIYPWCCDFQNHHKRRLEKLHHLLSLRVAKTYFHTVIWVISKSKRNPWRWH